ncbi:MAG: ROK family protein [Deferribacteraceae bacterium]|jgi:glucokinase|nr:ROK family protein [Deferribacteraceae bacterium]
MKHLAIDIGGSFVKSGIINGSELVKDRLVVKTPESYEKLIAYIAEISNRAAADSVCLAIPGVYDKVNDRMLFSPNLAYLTDKSIKTDLAASGVSVLIENDANLATLGEYMYGYETPPDTMILLTLGTGVGGGIIQNGKLLTGGVTSTELGHMTLVAEGRVCGCGKRGCVEKYCSVSSILHDYHEASGDPNPKTVREVVKLYEANDFAAFAAIDLFTLHISHAMSSLINIFVPQSIRIGGGLSEISDYFIPQAREMVDQMVFPAFRGLTDIAAAKHRNDAALLGAAEWAKINMR